MSEGAKWVQAPRLGRHARRDGGAVAGQVREGDVEDLVRTHGFEDAVEALGDEGAGARVEVRFQEDVVSARGLQLGDFVRLARRGDEGALVVGGGEDGPEPRLLVPPCTRTVNARFGSAASKREPHAVHMLVKMPPRTSQGREVGGMGKRRREWQRVYWA